MKYQDKQVIVDKYLPRLLQGLSFSELEEELKVELPYNKERREVMRSMKKSLQMEYLEIFIKSMEQDIPYPDPIDRFDKSIVDYLEEAAKTKITQGFNKRFQNLTLEGVPDDQIIERLGHPRFFPEELIRERIEARRKVEKTEEEQKMFSFKGKIDRKLFGKRLFILVVFGLLCYRIIVSFRSQLIASTISREIVLGVLTIVAVPVIWFLLSQITRRLRDMGLPTWGIVLVIVGMTLHLFIGVIGLLVMLFVKKINIGKKAKITEQ